MDPIGGEIKDAGGYVFVRNESVPDERRARQILAAVDDALRKSGHRSVLFDTREMMAPSEPVNAILRWWVDAGRLHDKVALLVKSDLKRIASNMRALSVGVQMRSFHELSEAEAWLRKSPPKPRVGASASQGSGSYTTTPRDSARTASRDTSTTPDPGPASRWRSPLLRGIVGSGNDS